MPYDNNLTGAIWKNDEKEPANPDHEKWADFNGQAEIDGIEYWVSAWKRPQGAKDKAPALKFKFQRKVPKQAPAPQAEVSADIPF